MNNIDEFDELISMSPTRRLNLHYIRQPTKVGYVNEYISNYPQLTSSGNSHRKLVATVPMNNIIAVLTGTTNTLQ